MIIHLYQDGSQGFQYEIGDRVIVESTIGGGWFNHGPVKAEKCVVKKIHDKKDSWRIAQLEIHYADDWGLASCFPWQVKPHPDTLASAKTIPVELMAA